MALSLPRISTSAFPFLQLLRFIIIISPYCYLCSPSGFPSGARTGALHIPDLLLGPRSSIISAGIL